MKNISELGLELIELEDQVLLVDNLNPKVGCYLVDNDQIYGPFEINDHLIDYIGNIIASTKPLEGLPLLVIEDEVEKLIDEELIKTGHESKRVRSLIYGEERELAKTLYYKAKETYKFTEEDLRKAIDMARKRDQDGCIEFEDDEIIQSLTKKELWIEVDGCSDCHLNDGYMSSPNCCREVQPKIINNQIKATYK